MVKLLFIVFITINIVMNIIGIDLSLTCSGLVSLVGEELSDYTLVKSSPSDNPYTRLNLIKGTVISWIRQRDPDLVVCEGIAFSSNGKATRNLAGLHYMVVCDLLDIGYEVKIVTPTRLKKVFTGNGKASKSDMIQCVPEEIRERWLADGIRKTTGEADLADAYGLAICFAGE